MEDGPIACNLSAFEPGELERYRNVCSKLVAATEETRELHDGFAFGLRDDAETFSLASEFVTLERRCCPFLSFSLSVEREEGVWLTMTGPEGVKPFLKAELEPFQLFPPET